MIEKTVRYTEAGLYRRPYRIALGSPTMREAHERMHIHWERAVNRRPHCVYKGSAKEREAR